MQAYNEAGKGQSTSSSNSSSGILWAGSDAVPVMGNNEAKSIDDILDEAEETTNNAGVARNFEKTGGYEKTLEDFSALQPSNVKNIQTQYGSGKVGYLKDGTAVVARPGSKTGGATLEIKILFENNRINPHLFPEQICQILHPRFDR